MTQLSLTGCVGVVTGGDSTDAQCTPRDLALDLGRFDLDVCSNPHSFILADRSFMLENGQDGLAEEWVNSDGSPALLFANFPYSHPDPWCERLRDHAGGWVALPKHDPTPDWWHQLMAARPWWAPFKKRLKFHRPGNCGVAPFPSALIWKNWTPPAAVLARLWAPRRES